MAPLAWSPRLAVRSQDWADTLLARRKFVHRPNSTYGENLFEITGASRMDKILEAFENVEPAKI
ncbi:MAG: CAP domain-containing protein [Bryobacteraceae bacterium]|jgi:hypothetical protein